MTFITDTLAPILATTGLGAVICLLVVMALTFPGESK